MFVAIGTPADKERFHLHAEEEKERAKAALQATRSHDTSRPRNVVRLPNPRANVLMASAGARGPSLEDSELDTAIRMSRRSGKCMHCATYIITFRG